MYPPNSKFLVIDDIASMRKMIKKVLNEDGYQNVVEAVDGKKALEKLMESFQQNEPFNFIICDWEMPNMSGIELLRICKADTNFKNIPFILVTADSDQKNIIEAIRSGVAEFIIKPFNANTLRAKLEKVFQKELSEKKVA